MKRRLAGFGFGLAVALFPTWADAWGFEGHAIVAAIARSYLTPAAAAKVDALLAADTDSLTAPDLLARAAWADAYRSAGHRETASWHFADTELDAPDLKAACFGFPAAANPASAGPEQDCVIDKVSEFTTELKEPATSPSERILAFKYLLHFVGDLHQPLHSADNHDRGGNCVPVALEGVRTTNLHAYWDTTVVQALGTDAQTVADHLRAQITPAQKAAWEQGAARSWSLEAFGVAKAAVYTAGAKPGCGDGAAPLTLPPNYAEKAQAAAAVQLERAGVRLAYLLNQALN